MKVQTLLHRECLRDVVGLYCRNNLKHCWLNLRKFDGEDDNEWFIFCGVWDREPVTDTLFNDLIQKLPMPKAKALNHYTEKELGLTRKGVAHCPLCLKEAKGLHPLYPMMRRD
jgi:hypothetical protein